MREILFRGKSVYNEEWFYGDLLTHEDVTQDSIEIRDYINRRQSPVFRDTVGQYTGFTDENGTKIFEGDILKVLGGPQNVHGGFFGEVRFDVHDQATCLYAPGTSKHIDDFGNYGREDYVEVIGNLYDNPELLEEIE